VLLRVVAAAGKREGGISFLEQLPPDLATELRALGTSSFHADGTTLVRPGQRVDSLHLLVQGEAVVAAPAGETEHRRNGDAFAEDAFLEGSPSRVSVRARTAVQVLSLSRVQVAELVRRRPETGYFLGRLVTRGSRARVPEAGLAGRLETLPIPELVQILNICRKTGCLRLERPEAHAEVYFVDGEIRHASAGELAGEAAFHRVAEWTDATFAFDSGARAPSVSIPGPTMPLLLEAMRILDERRR
jgi:CRP-like cAMP-binding protein